MILPATFITLCAVGLQSGLSAQPESYWRNPRRCGINCLYAYLSIHGEEHELEEVASHVKLGPAGASFDDMQRAATDMGVPSSVVRMSDIELSRIPLPAIAHLDVRGGHYLLLLEVTPDTVTTADMSSGEIKEMHRNVFLETWSGYLLVRGKVLEWRTILWRGLALSLICLGLARLLHVLRHNDN